MHTFNLWRVLLELSFFLFPFSFFSLYFWRLSFSGYVGFFCLFRNCLFTRWAVWSGWLISFASLFGSSAGSSLDGTSFLPASGYCTLATDEMRCHPRLFFVNFIWYFLLSHQQDKNQETKNQQNAYPQINETS
jgi:hypothetical protein